MENQPNNKSGKIHFVCIDFEKNLAKGEIQGLYDNYISLLNKETYFYASIIHDKDINEDGTTKTIHAHILIIYDTKKTKKHTIKHLSELFGINTDLIGVKISNNDYLPDQYLTHKNDPDKYQYDKELITTNDIQRHEELYNKKYVKPIDKEQLLQDAFYNCNSFIEFFKQVGPTIANSYRSSFMLFLNEKRQNESLDSEIFLLQRTINTYEKVIDQIKDTINRIDLTPKQQIRVIEEYISNYNL